MKRESVHWKISVGLILSGLLLCCNKSSDQFSGSWETEGNQNVDIALSDIQNEDGCLDLQRYFQYVSSFHPQTPVLEVSTNLRFQSSDSIRENFKKMMAYGNFLFQTKSFSALNDFGPIEQKGCESLIFKNNDGSENTYQIQASSGAETLTAKNEAGEKIQYTWLSPMSMRILTKTITYDLPCAGTSEIFVEQTRILDWSRAPITPIDPLTSPLNIEPEFLTLVSQAVGYDENNLYETIPADAMGPERRLILPSRAQEMAALPPHSDLLACTEPVTPPPDVEPTPTPDPDEDSNTGDEP